MFVENTLQDRISPSLPMCPLFLFQCVFLESRSMSNTKPLPRAAARHHVDSFPLLRTKSSKARVCRQQALTDRVHPLLHSPHVRPSSHQNHARKDRRNHVHRQLGQTVQHREGELRHTGVIRKGAPDIWCKRKLYRSRWEKLVPLNAIRSQIPYAIGTTEMDRSPKSTISPEE